MTVPTDDFANIIAADASTRAAAGYDHPWFAFRSADTEPVVAWPNGAHTAVTIVIELSAVEWGEPTPAIQPVGGRGVAPYPDYPRMSHREFGHRVGAFRLFDLCEQAGIKPTVSVDVLTARHYPQLVERVQAVAGEVVAGGVSGSQPITAQMSLEEERDYIRFTLDELEAAFGTRPVGWLSPERSESASTPTLLAEAGVSYVLDWANDERPYPSHQQPLWFFPLSWELADVNAGHLRLVDPEVYAASIREALTVLTEDANRPGRVLGLQWQPWQGGQAFWAQSLTPVVGQLATANNVWHATAGQIIEHCRTAAGER